MKKKLTQEQIDKIIKLIEDVNNRRPFTKIDGCIVRFTIHEEDGKFELHGDFTGTVYVEGAKYLKTAFDNRFSVFAKKFNISVGKARQGVLGSYKCLILG